jgi:predicted PurR-regulated permease PerM
MKFGTQQHLLFKRINKTTIAICMAVVLMIAAIGAIINLAITLHEETSVRIAAEIKITQLENELSDATRALKLQNDTFNQQQTASEKANDDKVGAFAKQAAKCVPLMQKFGVHQ